MGEHALALLSCRWVSPLGPCLCTCVLCTCEPARVTLNTGVFRVCAYMLPPWNPHLPSGPEGRLVACVTPASGLGEGPRWSRRGPGLRPPSLPYARCLQALQ